MHLFIRAVAGLINLALAAYGLYTAMPRLAAQFNVATGTAFLVSVVPFAATAVYALGARSKPVWFVAALFNLLAMLGVTGLIVFTKISQSRADPGAFIAGLAIAGVIATANLAFLLWRAPHKSTLSAEQKEMP